MTEIFQKIKRRYFEAFGDLEKEIAFLRKANLSLCGIIFFLLLSILCLGLKPPVVIRVSEVEGARMIQDINTNNLPASYEVIGFAKRFTARYTAFNSYTMTRDLAEAFNLMTARLQKEARKTLVDSGLVEKLKEAGIDTQLEFKEAKIERDSSDVSTVSLVGLRRVTKYQDARFQEEILFRADIAVRKVKRTATTPEGLLIEAYREITLNDLSRKDEGKS